MKTTTALILALAAGAHAFAPLPARPTIACSPPLTVRHVSNSRTNENLFNGDDAELPPMTDVIHIHELLLQRSIQTQLYYLQEVRNEVKATWLAGFLKHEHLDNGNRWHAVFGMKTLMTDYFRALLRTAQQEIDVEVKVGGGSNNVGGEISDAWTTTKENVEEDTYETEEDKALERDLKPWLAASNSRKRNPYLNKEPQVMTYQETIDPRMIAAQLENVVKCLSREWQEDLTLQFLADDPEQLEEARIAEGIAFDKKDQGNLNQPTAFDTAERCRTGSSPLRRRNYDLLERGVTIIAIRSLESELAYNSAGNHLPSMELRWLDAFMKGWWARLSGAVRESFLPTLEEGSIVERMLEEMSMEPSITDGDDTVSPRALAGRIHEHRQIVQLKLMSQLADTQAILDSIHREDTEWQLEKMSVDSDRVMLEMVMHDT